MDNFEKVNNVEQSDEANKTAQKAKNHKIIIGTSITALTIFIITTTAANKIIYNRNKKQMSEYNNTDEMMEGNTIVSETIVDTIPCRSAETTSATETSNEISTMQINYTGANTFYNDINNLRNTNKLLFTNVFQTEEDVKDYVNFICYFDSNYDVTKPTTINSLNDFLAITDNYYEECAQYNIKPELNTLLNNNTYMQNKVQSIENLANNLQATSGNDYTIANEYYSELANDLCTTSGINTSNIVNCPGCEIIISVCKNYNHIGNAYQARQNEKTVNLSDMSNTLNINNVDDEYLCPDSTYKSIENQIKALIDEQISNNYENLERSK